jgi:7-carboxy-7-deazaguanine synthase
MRISEIFKSIQGEGRNQGKVATFIRCAGCNIRCRWCDTQYAWAEGEEMAASEVLHQVRLLGSHTLCITGGEPLVQADLLLPLVCQLFEEGYDMDIETNGTLDFTAFQPYATVCMDVKCPSSGVASDLTLLERITERDSVKFVVGDTGDLCYAEGIIAEYPIRGEVFISPVFGTDCQEIAEFIIEHDLPVRLQLQLHRIIGVR